MVEGAHPKQSWITPRRENTVWLQKAHPAFLLGSQLRHGHQGCTSPSFVGSAILAPAECPDSAPLPCAALHSFTCFFLACQLPSLVLKLGKPKEGRGHRASGREKAPGVALSLDRTWAAAAAYPKFPSVAVGQRQLWLLSSPLSIAAALPRAPRQELQTGLRRKAAYGSWEEGKQKQTGHRSGNGRMQMCVES